MKYNILDYLTENRKKTLLLLFIVALILRGFYTYIIYTANGTSNWSDDFEYLQHGEQFANGNWNLLSSDYEQMVVGPAIPLIVALFSLIFADPVIPFFVYNIIATSLLVIILFFLGKEIFNDITGWLLSIWSVFFIEALKYSPHVLKEPTIFLFLPLTVLLLVQSLKKEKYIRYIIGASLSFAWLIHTDERFFIYFPFFVLVFLFKKPLNTGVVFKSIGVWLGLTILLMMPWAIKNYKTYDQVVILTPRTTVLTSKFFGDNINTSSASHFLEKDAKEKLIDSRYEKALKFGKEHGIQPREYKKNEARIKAFFNFWQPVYFNPTFVQYGFRPMMWSLRHNLSSIIFYGIFLPFYIAGFFLLIKRRNYIGFFLATIPIIHSLVHAYMIWPLERYRSPVTFIIVMLGIWFVTDIQKLGKKRSFPKPTCSSMTSGPRGALD